MNPLARIDLMARFRSLLGGLLAACAVAPAWAVPAAAPASSAPQKVLHYAFRVAETSFDPAALSDIYSRIVTGHIFEGLYGYDPLARPALIRPLVATALPEIGNDFRTFTVHVKPGIFFADDPAFGGKPRELVAQDFVYALERVADPATRSPNWASLNQNNIVGLAARRQRALDAHLPFDYDTPVSCLPGCLEVGALPKYPPITVEQHMRDMYRRTYKSCREHKCCRPAIT